MEYSCCRYPCVSLVREREALKRYLDHLERADEENEVVIDASAVADALEKLKSDPEPEAALIKIGRQHLATTCKPLSMRNMR